MIEFRQKDFGKLGDLAKRLWADGKEKVDKVMKSPEVKTGLTASGTVLGVANLNLNLSRKKEDTRLREEQLKAMEDLTRALKEAKDENVRQAAERMRPKFRVKHPEDIHDEDVIVLPNPVSSIKKTIKKK
jgi:hypothetical protein